MSELAIVGIVLASIQSAFMCLDLCEKLPDEPWDLKRHFLLFVREYKKEQLKYQMAIKSLLTPVVKNEKVLTALINDPNDPYWHSDEVIAALKQRFPHDHIFFSEAVEGVGEAITSLNRLFKTKERDVHVPPAESSDGRQWESLSKRIRIRLLRKKDKKLRRLKKRNEDLLWFCFSTGIEPLAEGRSANTGDRYEKIRQQVCHIYEAIELHWTCENGTCLTHQANLGFHALQEASSLDMLFTVRVRDGRIESETIKREMEIRPLEHSSIPAPAGYTKPINNTKIAQEHMAAQERVQDKSTAPSEKSQRRDVPKLPGKALQRMFTGKGRGHDSSSHPAGDLCSSVRNYDQPIFANISDGSGHAFRLSSPISTEPDTARLVSLPELVEELHRKRIEISLTDRKEMASNLASALLQIQPSQWAPRKWWRSDFYFLVGSKGISGLKPYVAQAFPPISQEPPSPTISFDGRSDLLATQKFARNSLFTVGAAIMELIFCENIGPRTRRPDHHDSDNMNHGEIDVHTAHEWTEKLSRMFGPHIADVVRRCIDCSFDPVPDFEVVEFRRAVDERVISPLIKESERSRNELPWLTTPYRDPYGMGTVDSLVS